MINKLAFEDVRPRTVVEWALWIGVVLLLLVGVSSLVMMVWDTLLWVGGGLALFGFVIPRVMNHLEKRDTKPE